jgi:hypothetical protein
MMYNPSTDEFDALAYGAPHPGTMQYIRQKFENLSTNLSDVGQQFMSDARQKWDQFMGSEAMRRARAIRDKLKDALYLRDEVHELMTLGGLQSAPPVMQAYLMSEPTIRQRYYDQRLEGYSLTYKDPNQGLVGEDDPIYRRVMQGAVVDTPDGEWMCRTWIDDLPAGEVELAFDQRAAILNSWDAMRAMLDIGKSDPTSQTGGWL